METKDLIKELRDRVESAEKCAIQGLSDGIRCDTILEAADRLEELERANASLAKAVNKASDTLRARNEKLKDMRKIADFYHRELEKKCKDSTKRKPFFFTQRKKLSDAYYEWVKENGASDCPFNVINFLTIYQLIDEEKAKDFLETKGNNDEKT